MKIAPYLLFFVSVGYGALTIDWSVDPLINHAIKMTKVLFDQHFSLRHTAFITLNGSDLNLDPFFRQLPSTTAVSVISWESLVDFAEYMASDIKVQLVVLVMDPELQKARSVENYNLNTFGFRKSCKVIAIMPDVVELNETFVVEQMDYSFLRKHSIVFLYADYAMLYKDFAYDLTNVTDKMLRSDRIFEEKMKLDNEVLLVVQMDDPPRSTVVDERVTGLDGLFLDGYVEFMNTSYVVHHHYDRRIYYSELEMLLVHFDVLIFNIIDFVSPVTEFASMFYMFKFTHKCLLVPKQPPISLILQFLRILQPSLVIFLLMMFVVFGLVLYLVLTLRPHLKTGILEIYFTLFQIAITNSVQSSKLRTLFERISLFACIVACFLIVSGVQSLLNGILVSPFTEEINTVEQLDRSNVKIVAKLHSKILLEENFGAHLASKVVDVDYPTTKYINRSYAYLLNKEDVDRFYYSSANFLDGVQQMHRMQECLEKQYRGYVGSLDSSHMESMHFYLQAIEESGIRQHWEQEHSYEEDFKRNYRDEGATITFVQIKKVSNLMLCGYGAATLAFLMELVTDRVKRWRSK